MAKTKKTTEKNKQNIVKPKKTKGLGKKIIAYAMLILMIVSVLTMAISALAS